MSKLFLLTLFVVFNSPCFASAKPHTAKVLYSAPLAAGYIGKPRMSPNDSYLVYTLSQVDSNANFTYFLQVVNLPTKQIANLNLSSEPWKIQFTADSKWIVFTDVDGIHFVDTSKLALDHTIALQLDPKVTDYFDVSKDGSKVVISNQKTVSVYDVATGKAVFSSGPLKSDVLVKFFNKSNNVSVFEMADGHTDFYSHHYVVDISKGTMTNTCPSDKCFDKYVLGNLAISADDNYVVYDAEGCATSGCTYNLLSYNISQAKTSTLFSMRDPGMSGSHSDLGFEYFDRDNALGLWIAGGNKNGGSIVMYSVLSPDMEKEIKTPFAEEINGYPFQPRFLPRLNRFVEVNSEFIAVCESVKGCHNLFDFGSQASIRDFDLARESGLIAIGQNRDYGMDKTQVTDLISGSVLFETHDSSITFDTPLFSSDEKFLIVNSFIQGSSYPQNQSTISVYGL